jgi:hypothetical protein
MKEQELLELLPDHFSQLKQMRKIAKAEGIQLDKLGLNIDALLDQGFINTATWGLRYWEERYKLPVLEDSLNYDERRQRVLAKKRSNKADLVDILRAVEPSIHLAWGGLILPFFITFDGDYYDFGELVRVLEEEKPSHLSYSFTVNPNGYTVRADRVGRNQVALQLISGTSKAGRWPSANTLGSSLHRNIGIKGIDVTGTSEYQKSAGLVSGAKDVPTAFGSVQRESINIFVETIAGTSEFNPSGRYKTGEISHEGIGSVESSSFKAVSDVSAGVADLVLSGQINTESIGITKDVETKLRSSVNAGISSPFRCGTRASGEEVA